MMKYHFYLLPNSISFHTPTCFPPALFVFDALLNTVRARAVLKFMGVGPPIGAWRLTGDHVLTKE